MQLQSTLKLSYFYLAANAFSALTPLQLDCLDAVLVDDIFRYAEVCILYVHLYEHFALACVVSLVRRDTSVHIGSESNLVVLIQLKLRINAAYILAAYDSYAGDSSAHCEMLPVFTSDFCGTERACENRHSHLYLALPAVLRLCVYEREASCLGAGFYAFGHALSAHSIALDVKMRIIYRIVLVAAGRDVSEGTRINKLSASECSLKYFTVASATVNTARAKPAARYYASGTVDCSCCIVSIRSL